MSRRPSRRAFLWGASAAVAATACTDKSKQKSAPAVVQRQKFRWRLVMVIPKTLPVWGPGVETFAKRVAEITRGDLTIKVYGAGELVPALGTFDAVKAGQVEMGHSASYYWQGKLPASAFFTAVPFGLNANGMRAWLAAGGQDLWNELYASHNVFSMPAGNTGMQMGGWFNKEIRTIDDYKGLKMRIPGLGGKVIAKAGAQPMLVAGGEIYTNLATGTIDATEWVGPYHDFTMGFHKAAKNYYFPGWHEPGPVLELMINKSAWNSLPKDLQEVVRTSAAALDRNMYAEWLAQDGVYLKKIANLPNVTIRPFPAPVLAQLKKHADTVKAEVAATSPLAKKIHESFETFQAQYDAHQKVSEHAYIGAGMG